VKGSASVDRPPMRLRRDATGLSSFSLADGGGEAASGLVS
jgi:hypothetical protein